MNIRLFNARIMTMKNNCEIFTGEVWVKNQTIVYCGPEKGENSIYAKTGMEPMKWDQEIDCTGNLLMPSFKNAHTHSAMTLLRSYADDLPLNEWLNNRVFPVEAQMNEEDIYHLSKLAILEYLTSGVSAVFEMYLTPKSIARAFDDMGMRCVQVGGVNNFSQSPELVEEMFLSLNQENSLQSYKLGFHAEYTCDEKLLEKISALSHKYKAPVFTHLAETKFEVEDCIKRNNMTPLAYLNSLGMFEYGGGGYHCVHMSKEDILVMAKKNLFAITNPGSNTKLASGIAPITDLLKVGVKVAIGTDGPASNNALDMFREMFLVTGLAKLKEQDAAAVDATKVLEMATVNGAQAMGLTDCDILEAGKKADIIMIDLKQPNMQPINNIAKNIVYSGSKTNVKMNMINGEIRYADHKFMIEDNVNDIYEKANEIIHRISK